MVRPTTLVCAPCMHGHIQSTFMQHDAHYQFIFTCKAFCSLGIEEPENEQEANNPFEFNCTE